MLAKPIGPQCNLDCTYCFYTEKKALYQKKEEFRMSDAVLENFIEKYIEAQQSDEVAFVWQGGEPTLLGVDYFRKIVALQKKYTNGKKISNSLQTNGTLIDDEWCEFLRQHDFLVGLSLDGPEEIHDRYRVSRDGKSSFKAVMEGLRLLKKYHIDFNVLCCVTKEAAYRPIDIYRFFKNQGIKFIQFIPIVERKSDACATELGLRLATPQSLKFEKLFTEVTDWTVEPEAYGNFLIRIFDRWVKKDIGDIHIMNFEWALASWLGLESNVCVFSKECGESVIVEHDGSIFSCDHYVYPDYRLGDIFNEDPKIIADTEKQLNFGKHKSEGLPQVCKNCEVKFACHGECPKHRFTTTMDGELGLNYLCKGYKKYFRHVHPYMKVMVQLIENDLPASLVKDAIKGPLAIKKN
jgi:uncharacterized protein